MSGGAQSPEIARQFKELTQATRDLADLSQRASASTETGARQRRIAELSRRIEQLEGSLAAASRDFRRQHSERERTAADVRKALPADAALVNVLEYYHHFRPEKGKQQRPERRVLAFVVRPDRPIQRVDLGQADAIAATVDLWRRSFGAPQNDQSAGTGEVLRRLVWDKLEPYLGDARLVLLSPDGATARFPWSALPGKKPVSFLIDERSIAIIPVPRQLPEMLAADGRRASAESATAPSVVLVGDVDFGADPGKIGLIAGDRGAERGGQSFHWSPLPGTRDEVRAIETEFHKRFADGKPLELTRDRATKEAVRAAIANCRYAHFSTHGFFAPPQLRSAFRRALALNVWQASNWPRGTTCSGSILACYRVWCWPEPIARPPNFKKTAS